MILAAPMWLLALGFALPVLLAHALRRKRRTVPSILPWREIIGPVRPRPRLGWPRASWPLALQLLAVLLTGLALAYPVWQGPPARHVIHVLDVSASMRFPGPHGQPRLDTAIEGLRNRIESDLEAGSKVSVLLAEGHPELLAARQERLSALESLLTADLASDGSADWVTTARLAALTLAEGEGTRLVIHTDGADAELATAFTAARLPTPEVVLTRSDGAGAILQAGVIDLGDGNWHVAGSVTVTVGATLPGSIAVTFRPDFEAADDPGLDWGALPLEPNGEEAAFDGKLTLPGPGLLRLALPGTTGLPGQEALFLVGRLPMKVALIGAPDPLLLRAIEASTGVLPDQVERPVTTVQGYDLVVINDVTLNARPEGNVLWVNRARLATETEASAPASGTLNLWRRDHPLTAGLDFAAMSIQRFHPMPALTGGVVLATVDDLPLVSARTTEAGRELRLGLDLSASSWTDDPALPLILSRFVEWAGLLPVSCVAGRFCPLPAHLSLRRIAGPDGTALGPEVQGEGLVLPDGASGFYPRRAGLYHLADGRPVLVSAAHDSAAPVEGLVSASGDLPLWRWLALALVAVLGAEALMHWHAQRRGPGPLPRASLAWRAAALAVTCGALLPLPLPRALPNFAQVTVRMLGPGPELTADVGGLPGGEALALASAILPADLPGAIALATGGEAPLSTPADLPAALRARGKVLDILPLSVARDPDPRVVLLDLPSRAREGDEIALHAFLHSPGMASLPETLSFLRDGELLTRQEVLLQPGINHLSTRIDADRVGEMVVELALENSYDRIPGNNEAKAIVEVLPRPSALLIAPDEEWGNYLAEALALQRFDVQIIPPRLAPTQMDAWLAHDLIILNDMPALALNYGQLLQLESAVRDHGRSLMILGGTNTFGPGGYFATPLEGLSPLSAKIPHDAPLAAVAFVIDRSGSMQAQAGEGTRLDVARAATVSAAELLDPASRIAVVGFDAEAHVLLPLSESVDTGSIDASLREIAPGGGTALLPALELAVGQLEISEVPLRHVIIMTDGLVELADFSPVIARARAAGITISAIAIGPTALTTRLSGVAKAGGGGYHVARDVRSLPGVLAQEALTLAGPPIVNRLSELHWIGDARPAFLAGLPENLPPIRGYVQTTLQKGATLHLALTDDGGETVPVMASWHQGAGRVLAFATEAAGGAVQDWLEREEFPRFWGQIARQMLPDIAPLGLTLEAVRQGDGLLVTLYRAASVDPRVQGIVSGEMTLEIVSPDAIPTPLTLHDAGGGRWRAWADLREPGIWRLIATQGSARRELAVAISYPNALDPAALRIEAATGLAALTGGSLLAPDHAPPDPGIVWRWDPMWRPWLVLALICLIGGLLRPRAFHG